MNRERIAEDVAAFHGWAAHGTGRELDAYAHVAEQALEREFHRTGCAELLAYYGLDG